jgi:MFS family permease
MDRVSKLRHRQPTSRRSVTRMALVADAPAENSISVPPLIRRNTLLLAATQAFVGTGTQLVPTLGGIMIERLLGSLALAGLGTSLLYFARLLIAYPIGWVMDTYGRKVGLMMGLALSLIGAVGVGLAMLWGSFPVFVAAMLVFGLGVGAGQQLRTAAADMYLPERRAEGLGYVLTGALLGALGGPLLIGAAQTGAGPLGLDSTALVWLLVPAVLVPSMALVFLIKPDPKAIAADLDRFYPGYRPPLAAEQDILLASGAGLRAWLAHYPLRVAFLAMFAAHGIMTMMMALTPLAMAHAGHMLTMISLAVGLHVVGMYGLSLPLGRLADRVGRRNVILAGLGIVAFGAVLVPLTPDYWIATAGLVFVGVGWSCVNVAVTALIADTVPAVERGRAIGVVDSFAGLASIVLPLLGGPLVEVTGFAGLAWLGVALVLGPAVLALRLAEPVPGQYAHALPA